MTNEQLRMQMLAGVITESQYKQKLEENKSPKSKKSLKENFVGMGMVGNIFDREKTDYELAFEHFAKGGLNEGWDMKFDNVEKHREYIATTDFSIFKKGDRVFVNNIRNFGTEVVLELENEKGEIDSINGDLEDFVEVFSTIDNE